MHYESLSSNEKLLISQIKSKLTINPCYIYDGTGFKYYIEKPRKSCPPGPTPVEVDGTNIIKKASGGHIATHNINNGKQWALALAVVCTIIGLSPHTRGNLQTFYNSAIEYTRYFLFRLRLLIFHFRR
jgi:hypothetical protein